MGPPYLVSDASSVWNFCARFSDVISQGNQWWCREMSAVSLVLPKIFVSPLVSKGLLRPCVSTMQFNLIVTSVKRRLNPTHHERDSQPGSHMPPMHLRHGRLYCLGYCSDMGTEVAGNIAHPSLNYPRQA